MTIALSVIPSEGPGAGVPRAGNCDRAAGRPASLRLSSLREFLKLPCGSFFRTSIASGVCLRGMLLAATAIVLFAHRLDGAPAELKDVTVAALESKLKALGPKPEMSIESMLAYLGLDPTKMEWDMGAYGGILYWARLEGGTREISLLKDRKHADDVEAEGTLRKVEIHDRIYSGSLLIWTPENGLRVPERAKPDPLARYLLDQPITTKWSVDSEGFLRTSVEKNAAQWHDARVPEWNHSSKEYGNFNRHRPAAEEVGIVQGTFTVRVPKEYIADGSWGLVLLVARDAGPYLPMRLRQTCDKHKLLYVGLQPSPDHVGYYWAHAAHTLNCMAELRQRFKFSSDRTMLAGEFEALPVLFAGLPHPELFGSVVLLTGQAVPTEQARDYMQGNGPIPLDWMESADWARNRELGQRVGMTWQEPGYHTEFNGSELQARWKETELRLHTIITYLGRSDEARNERREPERSGLAEFVEALVAKP